MVELEGVETFVVDVVEHASIGNAASMGCALNKMLVGGLGCSVGGS